jgi:hypothetical protein
VLAFERNLGEQKLLFADKTRKQRLFRLFGIPGGSAAVITLCNTHTPRSCVREFQPYALNIYIYTHRAARRERTDLPNKSRVNAMVNRCLMLNNCFGSVCAFKEIWLLGSLLYAFGNTHLSVCLYARFYTWKMILQQIITVLR